MSSRILLFALAVSLVIPGFACAQEAPQAPSTLARAGGAPAPGLAPKVADSPLTGTTDAAQRLIVDAVREMNKNDANGALHSLNQALQLNPNSTGAYVLRASIYSQRHQWQPAEDDFNAAAKIAPTNVVLRIQLAEVKFMEKQYDVSRTRYAALTKDPELGDFAAYKVFLCDLFGGHEAQAKKELDVFDDVMGNPSYYFANASWDLYHKNIDDARSWLVSASHIYPAQKFTLYGQSLRDLGYLPIPMPKEE
jgi:tetratricopeptide (TPR) repeat protein